MIAIGIFQFLMQVFNTGLQALFALKWHYYRDFFVSKTFVIMYTWSSIWISLNSRGSKFKTWKVVLYINLPGFGIYSCSWQEMAFEGGTHGIFTLALLQHAVLGLALKQSWAVTAKLSSLSCQEWNDLTYSMYEFLAIQAEETHSVES